MSRSQHYMLVFTILSRDASGGGQVLLDIAKKAQILWSYFFSNFSTFIAFPLSLSSNPCIQFYKTKTPGWQPSKNKHKKHQLLAWLLDQIIFVFECLGFKNWPACPIGICLPQASHVQSFCKICQMCNVLGIHTAKSPKTKFSNIYPWLVWSSSIFFTPSSEWTFV